MYTDRQKQTGNNQPDTSNSALAAPTLIHATVQILFPLALIMNTNILKEFIKICRITDAYTNFYIRDEMANIILKKHNVANPEIRERQQEDPLSNQFLLFRQHLMEFIYVDEEYMHIHREPE